MRPGWKKRREEDFVEKLLQSVPRRTPPCKPKKLL